jgi:hypothetical protein
LQAGHVLANVARRCERVWSEAIQLRLSA